MQEPATGIPKHKSHGRTSGRHMDPLATPAPLTDREIEVLTHMTLAKTNKQIASALDISTRTVKFHVKNILAKHGVTSRIQLLVLLTRSNAADAGREAAISVSDG